MEKQKIEITESSFIAHCTICKNLNPKGLFIYGHHYPLCLKNRDISERTRATRRCKDLEIARNNSKKRLELEEIYREGK